MENMSYSKKYLNAISSLLGGVCIILLPLVSCYEESVFSDLDTILFVGCVSTCLMSLIVVMRMFSHKWQVNIKVTLVDMLITVYILYGVINLVLVRECRVDPLWLVRWYVLIVGYILFRNINEEKYILIAIVMSGIIQTAIAVSQVLELSESNNIYFQATGSFRNPGPLGGYIGISGVVCCGLIADAVKRRSCIYTFLYILVLLILNTGLIIADSRAAFVSACGGALYLFWQCFKPEKEMFRRLFIASSTALFVVLFIVLIGYRPDSVKSRLLIWHVSADMMIAKPMLGHGVGGFNDEYMLWQAKYFETKPDSALSRFADTPLSTFNEFIHVGVEQGIIGVLLLLFLLFSVFNRKGVTEVTISEQTYKSTFLSILLFSLFSYPAEIFPIFFYFPIFLGLLRVQAYRTFDIHKTILPAGMIIVWMLTLYSFDIRGKYKSGSDCILKLFSASAEPLNDTVFSYLKNNYSFQNVYLQSLTVTKPTDTITCDRVIQIANSYSSYIELGTIRMRNKDYSAAKDYFFMSSCMMPNRIWPIYMLWKIAIEQNDIIEAVKYARKIMSFESKSMNTDVIMIKKEITSFLAGITGPGPVIPAR